MQSINVSYSGPCINCGSFDSKPVSPVTTCKPPSYTSEDAAWKSILSEEVLQTVDSEIDELNSELRRLSLDIWGKSSGSLHNVKANLVCTAEHPEVGYHEQCVRSYPCKRLLNNRA